MAEDKKEKQEEMDSVSTIRKFVSILQANVPDILRLQDKQSANHHHHHEDYKTEGKLLSSYLKHERHSVLAGVGAGVIFWSVLHFGPGALVKRLGGLQRVQQLVEADKQRRAHTHTPFRRVISNVLFLSFEGLLSFTVGTQTYDYYKQEVRRIAEDEKVINLANLPLVQGKSQISERICPPWLEVYQTLPRVFVEEKKRNENKSSSGLWTNIDKFAINCQRRLKYEQILRKKNKLSDHTSVCIPAPGLPEVILDDKDASKSLKGKESCQD